MKVLRHKHLHFIIYLYPHTPPPPLCVFYFYRKRSVQPLRNNSPCAADCVPFQFWNTAPVVILYLFFFVSVTVWFSQARDPETWGVLLRRTLKINIPKGEESWTEQCETLNCKTVASKPQHILEELRQRVEFCMPASTSHGPWAALGMVLILSRKLPFSNNESWGGTPFWVMRANNPGTWERTTELPIFSVYGLGLDPCYNARHSHIKR